MILARRLDEWPTEFRGVGRIRQNLARNVYERGRLRIDFDAYQVWVDGGSVHLMRREFELLRFFVQSANRVFDRRQILAHVWPRARINPRTVDVHVYRLRHCLERDPEHPELFVTVRGVGWRFDERTLREARGTGERITRRLKRSPTQSRIPLKPINPQREEEGLMHKGRAGTASSAEPSGASVCDCGHAAAWRQQDWLRSSSCLGPSHLHQASLQKRPTQRKKFRCCGPTRRAVKCSRNPARDAYRSPFRRAAE